MAGKKKVIAFDNRTEITVEVVPIPVKRAVSFLSIDYGREDINNIAKKVNEIIELLNT